MKEPAAGAFMLAIYPAATNRVEIEKRNAIASHGNFLLTTYCFHLFSWHTTLDFYTLAFFFNLKLN